MTVAQQIQDALRAPFFVDGQQVQLTASVGIACAPEAATGRSTPTRLLRDADVALSRAKERGRDRYEIFDEPMRVRLLDRVALESDLRAALDTRRAAPALPAGGHGHRRRRWPPSRRWSAGSIPTRGLLGPAEFIAVAEESDLIVSLGTWVIEEACEQIRRWRDAHPARLGVRVSVNVSARQLSPQLVDTSRRRSSTAGSSPRSLALEITESLLIEHTESAREVLAGLEALGRGDRPR